MTSHRLALISSLLTGSSFAFHLPTTTIIHRQPSLTNNNHHHHHQQRSQSVTLHQYPISITENAPRDTITITDWAINYGIGLGDTFQLTAAQQDDAIHDDVYTITSQPIDPSTPILSIPSNVILTGSMARQELGSQTFGAEDSLLLSDHQPFYLFLKVLTEYELGDQSPWYYWLNSLPRYYSNGASMTDFCFGCLPPYAAGLALAEKKRYKQYVEALSNISFLSEESKQSEEVTKWAFNVVFTRYMELPGGDVALVPMADYLNHGAEPNVDISYDEEGNCYVYSMTEVGAGEPLVFSYGDSTNPSNLLARYGFLDESSEATFCKYVIENPTFEMFNLGYPNSMYFYNDGGISNEVWDVLLYELLKGTSLEEQQQAFYQAHVSGDEATKQYWHEQYFPQTLAVLQTHVDYLVNELDDLSESSWRKTFRKDQHRHPRLPLILRHNNFVREIFELVQQNLDGMAS